MRVFWSDDQLSHDGARFMKAGRVVESPDAPVRAQKILKALSASGFDAEPPRDLGLDVLRRVHSQDYLDFLSTFHARWEQSFGPDAAALPNVMAPRGATHVPRSLIGELGFYTGDLASEIRPGTWRTVYASAQCAANAAQHAATGAGPAYALCRPPGHHAGARTAMGFCYLNNSAIAAAELRRYHARVAIVDFDVHHGNGTQDIFYDRGDVLTASMHSDPSNYYPFHSGYEDETGVGEGEGVNINSCYRADAEDADFLNTFRRLADAVEDFAPDAVVIGLGTDALRSDPHGGHRITPDAIVALAPIIRGWRLPTVVVQEGGYLSEELGPTVAGFLGELARG